MSIVFRVLQVLEVRRSRIILSVQPFTPVVGDLSILPAKPNSNESETDKVRFFTYVFFFFQVLYVEPLFLHLNMKVVNMIQQWICYCA